MLVLGVAATPLLPRCDAMPDPPRCAASRSAHSHACAGAGQDVMDNNGHKEQDASGNPILQVGLSHPCRSLASGFLCGRSHVSTTIPSTSTTPPLPQDIGVFLRDIFRRRFTGVDVKYIDPSYMIRSIPTITTDRIYCKVLGQGAVHGAFAGYTDFTVGLVNT